MARQSLGNPTQQSVTTDINTLMQKYIEAAMSGAGSTTAGRYLTQAKELKDLLGDEKTAEQMNKELTKQEAEQSLRALEDLYFFNERGPLAYSQGGETARISARIEGLKASQIADYNPELKTYNLQRMTMGPRLAKLAGDTGNIALQEQLKALGGMAQGTDTIDEAIRTTNVTREKFGLPPRDIWKEMEEAGVTATQKGDRTVIPIKYPKAKQTGTTSQTPPMDLSFNPDELKLPGMNKAIPKELSFGEEDTKQPSFKEKLIKGKAIPIVASGLSGLVGGLLGPLGAIGGAGVGYGAGDVVRRSLADLLKVDINEGTLEHPKAQNVGEAAKDILTGPAIAAGTAALTAPFAFAGGRNLLASGTAGQVSTAPIKKAVMDYSMKLPGSKAATKAFLETLPNKLTTKELVERLGIWGNAYSKTGDVKSQALAKIMATAYKPARQMLTQMSPATSMAQTGLSKIHGIKNTLGGVGRAVTQGAAGYMGASYGGRKLLEMAGQE